MDDLVSVACRAIRNEVARNILKSIDRLQPDTSAIADEHVLGYRAGFCDSQMKVIALVEDFLNQA